ncbi:hypothetical protein OEZ85_004484 [Tetradesmus obliquus]|uniref:EKC/KEOPS complex subunit CGI121 n=1 Tax=Tetradesmus obliquus TaxID=3088 RepID=A0ABY8UNC3_TETOB|nr:hypothetical protein OEZ85_004484 [Tetradesmus obliquus]
MSTGPQPAVLKFETHPSRTLTLLLFKGVTNVEDVRRHITEAKDPVFSFLNAETVADVFPLHLAGHKSLTAQASGSMVTKGLHTELAYSLSGTKHIGESLKRFGATETTKHLLVARFDAAPEDVAFAQQLVQGEQVDVEQLKTLANHELISKNYKVPPEELKAGSMADAVACRIASRDVV